MADRLPDNSAPAVQVRKDLKVHIRGDKKVILEDCVSRRHYRLGAVEYRFFLALGAGSGLAAAHQAATEHCASWEAESSQRLVVWLSARGLIVVGDQESAAARPSPSPSNKSFNPLFANVSLGSPDRYLAACARWLRPVLRAEAAWLAAICVLWAAAVLCVSWPQFRSSYQNLLTPGRSANLVVVALALKLVHEAAHGIACRHWGGKVSNCGVAFIFGVPLPFVDLSESCRFPARWRRIGVALAGVGAECLLAALLVLAWTAWDSPTLANLAADTVLVTVVGTFLFNLNPLMKYDGYYVLSECLRIDNLYIHGATYANSVLRRIWWGSTSDPSIVWPPLVKCYGLASLGWRLMAIATICIAAVATLQGIGIVLVGWFVYAAWIAPWLAARRQRATVGNAAGGASQPLLWLARPALVGLVVATAAYFVPLPIEERGYAVVEYDPPEVLRSPVNGFLTQVHVKDGEPVRKGQLLFTFACEEAQLAEIEIDALLAKTQQELQAAVVDQDASAAKELSPVLAGLHLQAAEARDKIASLSVLAAADGILSAPGIAHRMGTYHERGAMLASIGTEHRKRLQLLVDQETSDALQNPRSLRFLSPGGIRGVAAIDRVMPRVTRHVQGSTLGADAGGPLAVTLDGEGNPQFCQSHTQIAATLGSVESRSLRVGERVTVVFGARSTLGEWLYGKFFG